MKQNNALQSAQILPKPFRLFIHGLNILSPFITLKVLLLLIERPIRFKTPNREYEIIKSSIHSRQFIPEIKKFIHIYHLPNKGPKIIMVHGWSGRGTQFHELAKQCHKCGFDVLLFDAPAHGKSSSQSTILPEFVSCILRLSSLFGPFDFALGHSFGSAAIYNAVRTGVSFRKIISISAQYNLKSIFTDFVDSLHLPSTYVDKILNVYLSKYGLDFNDYNLPNFIQNINLPVLIIHCRDDNDVKFSAAGEFNFSLPNSQLVSTNGLGHRRILRDANVSNAIISFLQT